MGLVAAAGKPAEEIRLHGVPFEDLHRGGWDPEARLADQDRDGVAAEVIYPTVGMVALQPPRPRLQEGLLRRLQPLDRRVLRSAPGPPARLRPDGDAHAGGGHRRPRGDQGARAARRDDARQPGGRGLRLARLRRLLGRRDRARAAALVPHPDDARSGHAPRPAHERLPDDHPRLPGHHGHADPRRRLRAPSEAARRVRRGRRRLGAALHVPDGPRLQAAPQLAAARARSSRGCRRSTSPRTSTRRSRTTGSRSRPRT